MTTNTIIRLPQVEQRTGLPRSTIHSLTKHGQFKALIRLTARVEGRLKNDISEFIEARVKASLQM